MTTKFFDSIQILRFDKTKVAKEEFFGAKKSIKIWNVDVDNIVISKLIETNNNSRYLIGYLEEVKRPLVLILPKMIGFVKTFKDENNELISFLINDDKLLEKYKIISSKIEDLRNIEF